MKRFAGRRTSAGGRLEVEPETMLGRHLRLSGVLKSAQGVWILGSFQGQIETKDGVWIGPEASVDANIQARVLVSAGEVRGNVQDAEVVQLTLPGSFEGQLQTQLLSVEDGVRLKGPCMMLEAREGPAQAGSPSEEDRTTPARTSSQ